jgi:hypothetical protein
MVVGNPTFVSYPPNIKYFDTMTSINLTHMLVHDLQDFKDKYDLVMQPAVVKQLKAHYKHVERLTIDLHTHHAAHFLLHLAKQARFAWIKTHHTVRAILNIQTDYAILQLCPL